MHFKDNKTFICRYKFVAPPTDQRLDEEVISLKHISMANLHQKINFIYKIGAGKFYNNIMANTDKKDIYNYKEATINKHVDIHNCHW